MSQFCNINCHMGENMTLEKLLKQTLTKLMKSGRIHKVWNKSHIYLLQLIA